MTIAGFVGAIFAGLPTIAGANVVEMPAFSLKFHAPVLPLHFGKVAPVATKDPHIAMIDAHEALEQVKLYVKRALFLLQAKKDRGETLTPDDLDTIKRIRAAAVERTKRIQDELYMEIRDAV